MRINQCIALFLLTGLLACSQSKQEEPAMALRTPDVQEMRVEQMEAPASAAPIISSDEDIEPTYATAATSAPATAQPPANRKLVYHAEVLMKVADVPRVNQRMDSLTRALGAFVEEAAEDRKEDEWRHRMKIRVAPARFQRLLRGLGRLGTVEHQELSTEDVTAQHADISARLRSKRALEQRYLALLGKASKVADILEIEKSMGEIRENIESTESRLRALNHEVGFSTVTLIYYQPLTLPPPDQPVLSFGSRLVEAFYSGWQWLINLLLGLVSVWPLLLGLLAGGGLLRWWWRRHRARRLA